MKLFGAISTAVLSLTLGVGVPAYAQQEQHDQQGEQKDTSAQEKEKQKAKSIKQEKGGQQDRNAKQEERNAPQQHSPQEQQRTGANHGGRIPDDRYKANFGRDHRFRVTQSDYSNRRFQFGGYSFGFVDEWPSNWLYTQDVFVVEIDGVYYLCNASYPGVNLALTITL